MTNLTYGQYCGLARALELVGEPWALLIVRDLIAGPKSMDELRRGLPRMPEEVLMARLGEMEQASVVRRRAAAAAEQSASYELTEYGSELDDVMLRLGLWGARALNGPRRDEIITADAIMMALRAAFRPEAARGLKVSYQLRLGDISVYARIDGGMLDVGTGTLPDADLVVEAGPALKALMAGEMSPKEAIESGNVRLMTGNVRLTRDPGLLAWFVEIFHIAPGPLAQAAESALAGARRNGHHTGTMGMIAAAGG
jgi:DNA-binding HxlR family transcriptional regulator